MLSSYSSLCSSSLIRLPLALSTGSVTSNVAAMAPFYPPRIVPPLVALRPADTRRADIWRIMGLLRSPPSPVPPLEAPRRADARRTDTQCSMGEASFHINTWCTIGEASYCNDTWRPMGKASLARNLLCMLVSSFLSLVLHSLLGINPRRIESLGLSPLQLRSRRIYSPILMSTWFYSSKLNPPIFQSQGRDHSSHSHSQRLDLS